MEGDPQDPEDVRGTRYMVRVIRSDGSLELYEVDNFWVENDCLILASGLIGYLAEKRYKWFKGIPLAKISSFSGRLFEEERPNP